ncbi:MAG: hypothetical protein K1000chlam2_01606 [Chlamydiae bacterium]|nr:hypothetical protein [Chlamydiota bacterium]
MTQPILLSSVVTQIQNHKYLDASESQRGELVTEMKKLSINLSDYIEGHFNVSHLSTGDGSQTSVILTNLKQLKNAVNIVSTLDQLAQALRDQQAINSRNTLYNY